jgi:tRNA uridine 5-carboxymethylaminomethyl modification enzyme
MFTSRAEHRLVLRHDNADMRLMPLGHALGLIDDEALARMEERRLLAEREIGRLRQTRVSPVSAADVLAMRGSSATEGPVSAARLLSRPELSYDDVVAIAPPADALPPETARYVETEIKYGGYIARERSRIDRLTRLEHTALPESIDYTAVHGLSTEAGEKLRAVRPETIGQAGRIPGVSPADVAVLVVHLKSHEALQEA